MSLLVKTSSHQLVWKPSYTFSQINNLCYIMTTEWAKRMQKKQTNKQTWATFCLKQSGLVANENLQSKIIELNIDRDRTTSFHHLIKSCHLFFLIHMKPHDFFFKETWIAQTISIGRSVSLIDSIDFVVKFELHT